MSYGRDFSVLLSSNDFQSLCLVFVEIIVGVIQDEIEQDQASSILGS